MARGALPHHTVSELASQHITDGMTRHNSGIRGVAFTPEPDILPRCGGIFPRGWRGRRARPLWFRLLVW